MGVVLILPGGRSVLGRLGNGVQALGSLGVGVQTNTNEIIIWGREEPEGRRERI